VADLEYALSMFIVLVGLAYTAFIGVISSRDEREQHPRED
jgi:hypothetical protein